MDSIKWGMVNFAWKDEVIQVYQLSQRMEIENFSNCSEGELKLILNNEKINKDSILNILGNSFLLPSNQKPFFKIRPQFYLLEKRNGDLVKMGISKFYIFDFTNKNGYRRE